MSDSSSATLKTNKRQILRSQKPSKHVLHHLEKVGIFVVNVVISWYRRLKSINGYHIWIQRPRKPINRLDLIKQITILKKKKIRVNCTSTHFCLIISSFLRTPQTIYGEPPPVRSSLADLWSSATDTGVCVYACIHAKPKKWKKAVRKMVGIIIWS